MAIPVRRASVCLTLLLASGLLGADAPPARLATLTQDGQGLAWSLLVPNTGATLRVRRPDGQVEERLFPAGVTPAYVPAATDGAEVLDGSYVFELRLHAPALPASGAMDAGRGVPQGFARTSARVVSGAFRVSGGRVMPSELEPQVTRAMAHRGATSQHTMASRQAAGSPVAYDQVIADDLIVTGSFCVGFDCVDNESFGFDTIRLKENNTRIKFDDTSSTAGFPNVDWQLTANDSASGGANKFSIEDVTNARVPFTVEALAPTNALYVDDGGRLGLGTATPVLDVHVLSGNTPAFRLDQDNTSGWTAQVWDVAGNEANFFIRDVTGGSRLPFRIQPGAPTNTLTLRADGRVGIGTWSPSSMLTVDGQVELLQGGLKFPDGTVQTTAAAGTDAVTSLNGLIGAVQLEATGAATLSQSGNTLQLGVTLPPAVQSLNGLTGNVQLQAAAPLTLTPTGGALVLGAGPLVTSVNGTSGALEVVGTGQVQVSTTGNRVTIHGSNAGDEGAFQVAAVTGIPDPACVGSLRVEGALVRPYAFLVPAAVTLRYPVVATPNLTTTGRPVRAFKVRYQDSDGPGTGAQVLLKLHRSDLDSGATDVVWTFDSNQHPTTGADLRTVEVAEATPGTDFTFQRYAYWIEATLTKRGTERSAFGQLRIRKTE